MVKRIGPLSSTSIEYLESIIDEDRDLEISSLLDKELENSLSSFTSTSINNNASKQLEKKNHYFLFYQMIKAFRFKGHLYAKTNPLIIEKPKRIPELHMDFYGIKNINMPIEVDLSKVLPTEEFNIKTVKDLLDFLHATYCNYNAYDYMHISQDDRRRWLSKKIESNPDYISDKNHKLRILKNLISSTLLENHLSKRYPGIKRFGIEGCETLITLLEALVYESANNDVTELVFGMAHRGRLNTLVNLFGKAPSVLFDEFEGKVFLNTNGDIKYHQGLACNYKVNDKKLHLVMYFNPSHLEIVAPVVEGAVRARQDSINDNKGEKIIPILVHGDAAISGQGVVMETLQMNNLRGFKTGGTIHIVANNQIGFTLSNDDDMRSTRYCTDIAKMIDVPVFHVNAEQPEAVVALTKIAMEYRNTFSSDVFINLIGYRRHGHNEADEPRTTQPMMYKKIDDKKQVLELYKNKLIGQGIIDQEKFDELTKEYLTSLETGNKVPFAEIEDSIFNPSTCWDKFSKSNKDFTSNVKPNEKELEQAFEIITKCPENLTLHCQAIKVISDRKLMQKGEKPINWGCAESLAYATLLEAGYSIRLIGQDVKRGTFAHRHAALLDQKTGSSFVNLKENTSKTAAKFRIFDSFLSEEAVLGFEYGYATSLADNLSIWEAQFGDFSNVAQVVIDQFIASGETKWDMFCGLTMLLPHGYEGQGPEHSSARVERFLQLCAEKNMLVCIPTTPGQIFHLLRKQMFGKTRVPLIIFSPKSLLRHKSAVSIKEDLLTKNFQEVIENVSLAVDDNIENLILCSGKVYYDLDDYRTKYSLFKSAIVRIEQLYPFPSDKVRKVIKRYKNLKRLVWAQEEPKNQGAWYTTIRPNLYDLIDGTEIKKIYSATRDASATTAVGYKSVHNKQKVELIKQAFDIK